MSTPPDDLDVKALMAAGKWAEAAAAARAAGDYARACQLYEKLWEFRAAAECALAGGDRIAALRNLIDARALEEATALGRELAAAGPGECRAAADVFEARRLYGQAARLHEGLGDGERAAALYARAGQGTDAARVYERIGRDAEARRLLERVVADEDGEDRAQAHLMLGRLLGRRREHDEAARHLQEAARTPDLRAEALRLLVVALAALGLRDGARDALARARADDPTLPQDLDEHLRAETMGATPQGASPAAAAASAGAAGGEGETLVGGRYRLLALLGAGGSGRVFRARDEVSGNEVAVKLFYAANARAQDTYARFVREAKVCGAIRHENLVQILDFREELGFFVMELMAGGTLADRMKPRVTPAQARRAALEVIAGLTIAHGRGIVHRDLKPANVFFDARGTAKLGDFGVAHLLDLGQTQTGGLIGTLAYMAPEQITGAPLTFAADLYALGVTFYQALTGRLPLLGPDFVAQHLGVTPPAASEAWPELGTAWDATFSRLLEKDPGARHGSLDELADELARIDLGERSRVLVLGRTAAATGATTTADGVSTAPVGEPAAPAAALSTHPRAEGGIRYVHETPLGATAISSLHRAVDGALGRSVVLERFADGQPDAGTAQRLYRMASAASAHLQRILAFDRAARIAVYEAPVGETLTARMASGPLAPRAAARVLAQLARALAPLHAAGGAHGAVEADRVVIDDSGTVTLSVAGLGNAGVGAATASGDVAACLAICARALGEAQGEAALLHRLAKVLLSGAASRLAALPLETASDLSGYADALDRELIRAERVAAHVAALREDARNSASPDKAMALVEQHAHTHGLPE